MFKFHKEVAHLREKPVDLAHGAKVFNIVGFASEKILSGPLDLILLLGRVRFGADDTRIG